MTTRTDYTPEEWETLQDAPYVIAGTMLAIGYHSIFGTLKGAFNIPTIVTQAAEQFSGNTLIQGFLPAHNEQHEYVADKHSTHINADDAKAFDLQMCRQIAIFSNKNRLGREVKNISTGCCSLQRV